MNPPVIYPPNTLPRMGARQCRWPIGEVAEGEDASELTFCCRHTHPGESYCWEHGDIAYPGRALRTPPKTCLPVGS